MISGAHAWTERTSVFSRVAFGIVCGFIGLHVATNLYFGHEKMISEAGLFASSLAERAAMIAGLEQSRPELVKLLSSPLLIVRFQEQADSMPARVWPHSREIREPVLTRLQALDYPRADEVRVWYAGRPGDNQLHLQLPLSSGGWLSLQAAAGRATGGHSIVATLWSSLFVGLILLAVLWVTRRFTSHLPQIAAAAERVGRDVSLPSLPERGPREVRRLSRAFNTMQKRVSDLLDERNAMLGALSHDVRTLVTRLGLRMESIADESQRSKAQQDVEAITSILDETLAFARDDVSQEEFRELDLPSLLQSLVDDERDGGAEAGYEGPDVLTMPGQPVGLRRAFANLIGNAIRYGACARVVLSEQGEWVYVDIFDHGPGIPGSAQAAALKPYVRLDESRSRETGGAGLGLAIVASVVRRHRGALEFLEPAPEFGVRVRLPLSSSER